MKTSTNLTPWFLAVVQFVAGCSTGSADQPTPRVTVDLERRPQIVEIRGVARAAVRRLEQLSPNDTVWPRLVAVRVETQTSHTTATPAVIGRYTASNDGVRFEPRFPFTDGVSYRVEVDTAALARGAAASRRASESALLTHRFALPSVTRSRTTRVTAVHPSTSRVPSNLLRWYIETSAPMEPGSALEHVHLMDESGRELRGAFLVLDQELWDADRRRLTLLFDPGRVKRGVRTNLESGAPLVAGRRYRLVIDDGWMDGSGAPLASGFEHAFEAVDADRQSPNPDRWRLTIPSAGTRRPLVVAFGEPLDHALAGRLLTVLDSANKPVAGSVVVAEGDSAWTFRPEREWSAGDYTIRVGGALEDLAGNNLVRVFDADRRVDSTAVERDVLGASRRVRFRVMATR